MSSRRATVRIGFQIVLFSTLELILPNVVGEMRRRDGHPIAVPRSTVIFFKEDPPPRAMLQRALKSRRSKWRHAITPLRFMWSAHKPIILLLVYNCFLLKSYGCGRCTRMTAPAYIMIPIFNFVRLLALVKHHCVIQNYYDRPALFFEVYLDEVRIQKVRLPKPLKTLMQYSYFYIGIESTMAPFPCRVLHFQNSFRSI
jgi:hypothetical protein